MDDYYTLLGVNEGAGVAELRRAWRRLALRWHPDRAGEGATASFQKIQAAYAVLSDPLSRAAYDRRQQHRSIVPRRRTPAEMLSRVSGSLNGLLACGIAYRTAGDIIELLLTPEEAASGGMICISMRVSVRRDDKIIDDLFTAWLAAPPGVMDGEILPPSALLPGMINRVLFRVRIARA